MLSLYLRYDLLLAADAGFLSILVIFDLIAAFDAISHPIYLELLVWL